MATQTATAGDNEITLRDVVNHMSVLKGELSGQIKDLSVEMKNLDKKITNEIRGNTVAIQKLDSRLTTVEKNLKEEIKALKEDLFATAMDTVHIRKYVGMAVPDEE